MKNPFLWFLLCEGLYLFCARILSRQWSDGLASHELIWTAFRLLSILVMCVVFRSQFAGRYGIRSFNPWLFPCIGLLMLVPLLVGNWGLPASLSHLFAVTSLAVGVREELAYRGVLQTLLTGKFGFWTALILSNIVFVVYHYGAQPLTIWNVFQLFSFGCVLGVVFYLTQSLVLVAVLHALYDAIYCYTPLLSNPLSLWVGAVLLSIPLLGVIAIKGRTSQALGRFVIDQDR